VDARRREAARADGAPYSYLDREFIATAEVDRAVAAMEQRAAEELQTKPSAAGASRGDVIDAVAGEKRTGE
jgi:hypothetical protein